MVADQLGYLSTLPNRRAGAPPESSCPDTPQFPRHSASVPSGSSARDGVDWIDTNRSADRRAAKGMGLPSQPHCRHPARGLRTRRDAARNCRSPTFACRSARCSSHTRHAARAVPHPRPRGNARFSANGCSNPDSSANPHSCPDTRFSPAFHDNVDVLLLSFLPAQAERCGSANSHAFTRRPSRCDPAHADALPSLPAAGNPPASRRACGSAPGGWKIGVGQERCQLPGIHRFH